MGVEQVAARGYLHKCDSNILDLTIPNEFQNMNPSFGGLRHARSQKAMILHARLIFRSLRPLNDATLLAR